MGIPADSALQVNDETIVTVGMEQGSAEILIFTPNRFGGDEVNTWPAQPGPAGGRIGTGFSLGPFNDELREYEPGFCYVFGAAQGAVDDIVVDDDAARGQVVNPEIGGWVIVMPDNEEIGELDWQLVSPAGEVDAGRGFPGEHYGCANPDDG